MVVDVHVEMVSAEADAAAIVDLVVESTEEERQMCERAREREREREI